MAATKKKTPGTVIVTTAHRGVFWGTLEKQADKGRTVTLVNCRMAIYWGTTRGFQELAVDGPNSKSRVGALAPRVTLYEVVSVTECTEGAAAAWQSA